MGAPREPTFGGSEGGPEQDDVDRKAWRDGVAAAQTELADGTSGTALRNRVLLQIAHDGSQPGTTVTELWQASCDQTGDEALKQAYENLSWPQPTGA